MFVQFAKLHCRRSRRASTVMDIYYYQHDYHYQTVIMMLPIRVIMMIEGTAQAAKCSKFKWVQLHSPASIEMCVRVCVCAYENKVKKMLQLYTDRT